MEKQTNKGKLRERKGKKESFPLPTWQANTFSSASRGQKRNKCSWHCKSTVASWVGNN